MKEYKVKKEDLKGEIKDFPIEVVQKMVNIQIEQGYTSGISVFQYDKYDGFDWSESSDGVQFWGNVIGCEDFDLFFKKYPKK